MTADEAISWYLAGFNGVLAVIGGPFLVVVVIRWVRSFLAL